MNHLVLIWCENGSLQAVVMDESYEKIIPEATTALGEVPKGRELHDGSLHKWVRERANAIDLNATNGRPGYVFDLYPR